MGDAVDLSIILPAHEEGRNLATLLPQIHDVLCESDIAAEILVVTSTPDPDTEAAARESDAVLVKQTEHGYASALRAGFAEARGQYVLTMDTDLSHPPTFIRELWERRETAEVLVASRYVAGGSARMTRSRRLLSRMLNRFFARGLSLAVKDMSSGFRLYDARVLRGQTFHARDFDILQEILVRAYAEGWQTAEVPFRYEPRPRGESNARVVPFGIAYLRTFFSLWKLRNSILCADYDDRAYDGAIFLQRYWQRRRFRHVTELLLPGEVVLDVGCGSSRIIAALPPRSVAVDILMRKLRYARRFGAFLVQASAFALPFRDRSFTCVVCSQVIEHVARESPILDELCRVLAPGGRLVLGTPDYGGWQWPAIEAIYARVAPGAYADEHITHYSKRELVELFTARGYRLHASRSILDAELILAFDKPAGIVPV